MHRARYLSSYQNKMKMYPYRITCDRWRAVHFKVQNAKVLAWSADAMANWLWAGIYHASLSKRTHFLNFFLCIFWNLFGFSSSCFFLCAFISSISVVVKRQRSHPRSLIDFLPLKIHFRLEIFIYLKPYHYKYCLKVQQLNMHTESVSNNWTPAL